MNTLHLRTCHYINGVLKISNGLLFALIGGLVLADQKPIALPCYFLLVILLLCQALSFYACAGGPQKLTKKEFQMLLKNSSFLKAAGILLRLGIIVMAVELLIKK